ncbi:MAG: ribonuclease III [Clostridiales bacterium]|jgi:ribonuclease-3 family protein|nr:ribonuclease III [Clostridiales bacterium]
MNPGAYSGLVLAYIGDAVFELMARTMALSEADTQPGKLHKRTKALVTARAQSRMYHKLLPSLTPDEAAAMRRGRNACSYTPKSATPTEYRHATGVESLFGYVYLSGGHQRARELFEICLREEDDI